MASGDRNGGLTGFLDALSRLAARSFWLVVAIVVLIVVVQAAITQFRGPSAPAVREVVHRPPPPIPEEVDAEVAAALRHARRAAREAAEPEIEDWVNHMKLLADEDFLDWYFGYWEQQRMSLKFAWYWSLEKLFDEQPTAPERITGEVQQEFANRVLRPRTSYLRLERITERAVGVYVEELSARLGVIPEKYEVRQADWDRYLEDIAAMTSSVEGNRQVELSLKAVVVGGGVASLAAVRNIKALGSRAMQRIGSRVGGHLATKSAAGVATRTGTRVSARAGGKLLGPIIGVGIIVWDVWDHHKTEKVNRPILKRSIDEYLEEVGLQMLDDPETGVLGVIYTMESNVIESIEALERSP